MALKQFDPTDQSLQRERIVVYSGPGVGKSRFSLSLTPRFGKKILYYAADEGTKFLQFLAIPKRERVIVIEPCGDDAIKNFQEFCVHDWTKEYPEIGTIVIDTYTKIVEDTIQYSANTGAVTQEKHFKLGDPAKGGQIIPNRGDYNALESASKGYLSNLEQFQGHLNIILIMHEDIKTNEKTGTTYGGPSHPGTRMSQYIAGKANTVIRLTREPVKIEGESIPKYRVIANTAHDGSFVAKIRESDETKGNPLPRVVCGINPINFWEQYDELFAPKDI